MICICKTDNLQLAPGIGVRKHLLFRKLEVLNTSRFASEMSHSLQKYGHIDLRFSLLDIASSSSFSMRGDMDRKACLHKQPH